MTGHAHKVNQLTDTSNEFDLRNLTSKNIFQQKLESSPLLNLTFEIVPVKASCMNNLSALAKPRNHICYSLLTGEKKNKRTKGRGK